MLLFQQAAANVEVIKNIKATSKLQTQRAAFVAHIQDSLVT